MLCCTGLLFLLSVIIIIHTKKITDDSKKSCKDCKYYVKDGYIKFYKKFPLYYDDGCSFHPIKNKSYILCKQARSRMGFCGKKAKHFKHK